MSRRKMSRRSLNRQFDSDAILPDGDRNPAIVSSDEDEDNQRPKVTKCLISDKEGHSSGGNSVDLNVVERGSSEEQLAHSIQKAIKRTIKRFSNSSVTEDPDEGNKNKDKVPEIDDTEDSSDHDEVFMTNGNSRRNRVLDDNTDDELESYKENCSPADLEIKKSKKISAGEMSFEDSAQETLQRLRRKNRIINRTDSSDDDVPMKKIKSGLTERPTSPYYNKLGARAMTSDDELPARAATPEYGVPEQLKNPARPMTPVYIIPQPMIDPARAVTPECGVLQPQTKTSDKSEHNGDIVTNQEPVYYNSEAGGSKDEPSKLRHSAPVDESVQEDGFLDQTVEIADEMNTSCPTPSDTSGPLIGETSCSNETEAMSSDSPTTSDDEDEDEDYYPEDYGQHRTDLLIKQRQIQDKLATCKLFLKSGSTISRLEKSRLRLSISSERRKLSKVLDALKKLNAEERWEQSKYAGKTVWCQGSIFKDDSFEMDPAYLAPKLGVSDKKLGKKALATLNREQSLTVERLQDLHGSLVQRPVDNQRATDPRGLKVALMPHQQHALAWLQWREQQKPRGGVLADEMGLGKTLTMIALVMASIAKENDGEGSENEEEWLTSARSQRHLGGTLVVVPASLLAQWEGEVKARCKRDAITAEVYHGAKRETVPKRLAKNDIVITTYNIVCREHKMCGLLFKIRWRRVILDEAHVIRNHKSQPCESVCALHTSKRWAVTGTPLHNKEMDLYSLLKFLQCSPFDDVRVWKRWVDNRNDAGHERLATVMKTLMLRRTKQELQDKGELPPLPDKNVEIIEVTLDPEERLVYDKVMLYSRTLFAQFLTQRAQKAGKSDCLIWDYRGTTFTKAQNKLLSLHADVQAHEILVLLIRLRQVCCHPSLIKAMLDRNDIELQAGTEIEIFSKMNKVNVDEEDDEDLNDFAVDERVAEHLLTAENPVFDLNRQSSKMRAVIGKIEEILDTGDKVIVVSQWVGVLNIIAKELDNLDGASYRMFTGQVAVKDRQGILDDFNSRRSEPNILLLSLTAGGVGLNVVGANHMLLVDIHWNPQLESQAQDRIHRFGQTKEVSIYKYICADTIEERIQALQNKKLELARQVLSGTATIVGSKLSLDDIKSLFGI